MEELRKNIREVPDFPKKGIRFYDLTTLFKDPKAFHQAVDALGNRYWGKKLDAIVGVEARGFVLGAALAYKLGTGIVLVRKPGKLPARTHTARYTLEYGSGEVQMHRDGIRRGDQVLVVDDLIATGGTATAACELVERSGGRVTECCFLVELDSLRGRRLLAGRKVFSLLHYP